MANLKNILPTKSNLAHWHIIKENICKACGMEVEDSGHLFWCCIKAQELWEASDLFADVEVGRIMSFMDLLWLVKFAQNLDVEKLALFATLAWCLWTT